MVRFIIFNLLFIPSTRPLDKELTYPAGVEKYFDLIYHTQGKIKIFVAARGKTEVIDREIRLGGYFVIVTSEKMTAGGGIGYL